MKVVLGECQIGEPVIDWVCEECKSAWLEDLRAAASASNPANRCRAAILAAGEKGPLMSPRWQQHHPEANPRGVNAIMSVLVGIGMVVWVGGALYALLARGDWAPVAWLAVAAALALVGVTWNDHAKLRRRCQRQPEPPSIRSPFNPPPPPLIGKGWRE